jgi:methionyl-tRNA formyltransferase
VLPVPEAPVRLLLFLNNWSGFQVARWLRRRGEAIVGVVVPPLEERRFGEEILGALQMPAHKTWLSTQLRDPATVAQLKALDPEIGISASFTAILKPSVLDIFPKGCINLHSALLPYNRGWHTNVWPIVDRTPAGATIHYMDAGVDTGDIVAQRQVAVEATDTGGLLHEKITRDLVDLFKETWPDISQGTNTRLRQDHQAATIHKKAELAELSRIDLCRRYRACDLINILRARTYPPYPSAYYMTDDRATHVRVQLLRDTDLDALSVSRQRRQAFPGIDGNAEYAAKDLLTLLGIRDPAPDRFVGLLDDSGPVFVRAFLIDESEFDTKASPKWMSVACD